MVGFVKRGSPEKLKICRNMTGDWRERLSSAFENAKSHPLRGDKGTQKLTFVREAGGVGHATGSGKLLDTTIVLAANTSWNLVNFRSNIISALIELGVHVVAIAPRDPYSEQLA